MNCRNGVFGVHLVVIAVALLFFASLIVKLFLLLHLLGESHANGKRIMQRMILGLVGIEIVNRISTVYGIQFPCSKVRLITLDLQFKLLPSPSWFTAPPHLPSCKLPRPLAALPPVA